MRRFALTAIFGVLAACGGPIEIVRPEPATASELQANTRVEPPVAWMVQCLAGDDRYEVAASLTAAEIRAANNTFENDRLPPRCSPARPPRGSDPVIVGTVRTKDGRLAYLVDMYYPSNPRRPWHYIVVGRGLF